MKIFVFVLKTQYIHNHTLETV